MSDMLSEFSDIPDFDLGNLEGNSRYLDVLGLYNINTDVHS